MKRFIAMILVSILVTALFGTTSAFAVMGYTEDIFELPTEYASPTAMTRGANGEAVIAAHNGAGNWAIVTYDDMNAQARVIPLAHTGNAIEHVAVAPDGNILAALSMFDMRPPEGESGGGGPVRRKVAVEAEEAPGSDAPDNGPRVMNFTMDDMQTELVWFDASGNETGRFFVSGMVRGIAAVSEQCAVINSMDSQVNEYDVQGKMILEYDVRESRSIAINGDDLYVYGDKKLVALDVNTGKKMYETALETNGRLLLSAGNESVYALMESGLFQFDAQLNHMDQRMQSMGMIVGDPTNEVSAVVVYGDGSLMALAAMDMGAVSGNTSAIRIGAPVENTLIAYQVQANANASETTDFTITALRASAKLQKAANNFQRLHPELNVKLNTLMAENDPSDEADHIRTLNTDLIAGKGGDVLVLDGLGVERYARRGLLKDMSGMFDMNMLLPGIAASSFTNDGQLFALPTQFTFDLLWGNRAVVDQVHTLADLSNLTLESGQTAMYARSVSDWLELFYPASAAAFMGADAKPDFESDAFIQLLNGLYGLYETQGELPRDDMRIPGGVSQEEIIAVVNRAVALCPWRLTGLMDITLAYTLAGEEESAFCVVPSVNEESFAYHPSLMMSISGSTKQPELAKAFIDEMLTSEIQEMEQVGGLPTVSTSLDKLFADAVERSEADNIMGVVSFGEGNPIMMSFPKKDTLDRLRQLCDQLNTQVIPDATLMGFVEEESGAFFDGIVDVKSTAHAIVQRAWSYLNE